MPIIDVAEAQVDNNNGIDKSDKSDCERGSWDLICPSYTYEDIAAKISYHEA
jgi:hypothetical protein